MKPSLTDAFVALGVVGALTDAAAALLANARTTTVPTASRFFGMCDLSECSGFAACAAGAGSSTPRDADRCRSRCLGTTPYDQRDDLGVGLGGRHRLADLPPAAQDD